MSTLLNYNLDLFKQLLQEKNDEDYTTSVSYPLIYVDNKKSTYAYPTKNGIVTYSYKNLNKDKKTIKTITKYYYYKILDKWLYKDLFALLGFIKIVNDEPKIINSIEEYNAVKLANESERDIEKRVRYMEKIIISKDLIKHVLKKVISKYNIDWAELDQYESEIKKYFYNYLKDKFEETIKKA